MLAVGPPPVALQADRARREQKQKILLLSLMVKI